jgi:hypothetical protein
MKELVYNVKVATRDALLDRILDAADHIRNGQLKLLAAACVYVCFEQRENKGRYV